MGILDDIGAAINTGAGELWNSIVNVYNKWFGDGTQEDYQNFYELVNKLVDITFDNSFPAGIEGERERRLDHGTMVPLYFIRQKYKEGKIVNTNLELTLF